MIKVEDSNTSTGLVAASSHIVIGAEAELGQLSTVAEENE